MCEIRDYINLKISQFIQKMQREKKIKNRNLAVRKGTMHIAIGNNNYKVWLPHGEGFVVLF